MYVLIVRSQVNHRASIAFPARPANLSSRHGDSRRETIQRLGTSHRDALNENKRTLNENKRTLTERLFDHRHKRMASLRFHRV